MSCYQNCNDIPWWKFQQRQNCMADCDLQTYQEQVSANLQQTSASNAAIKWIIPALVALTILIIIAKAKKWI